MHGIPWPIRAVLWLIEHCWVLPLAAMCAMAGVVWWKRRR